MSQEFTLNDLKQFYPKYEEGMDLTQNIVQDIRKRSNALHNLLSGSKPLSRHRCLIDLDLSLIGFAETAEYLLKIGRTDSLEIFGWYLDFNDEYRETSKKMRGRIFYV
ncbi:hypothetical protein [Leuconostoc pseudomesenteroides]|uniref:hypothetical protein n=1 Tax=Leuconostoc pseudomesenteroides TaxID=33968 RepID=UPI001667B2A6|nr:hypothetical protein [Leuconostoc pseudomesenteroides]